MSDIIRKLKDSYGPTKRSVDRKENIFPYFIVRPISYFFTIPLVRLNVSANSVSIFSVFIAIIGAILIGIGDYKLRIIGALLIFLWIVLDCVDGNLARYYGKPSAKGEFLDAMGGYVVNATVFMSLGSAAYIQNENPIYLYLGYLSSICAILPRLLHQKWSNSVSTPNVFNSKGNRSFLIAVIQNFAAVSNFFQIFLMLSVCFGFEKHLLIIYTFINLGICLFTMVKLVK